MKSEADQKHIWLCEFNRSSQRNGYIQHIQNTYIYHYSMLFLRACSLLLENVFWFETENNKIVSPRVFLGILFSSSQTEINTATQGNTTSLFRELGIYLRARTQFGQMKMLSLGCMNGSATEGLH